MTEIWLGKTYKSIDTYKRSNMESETDDVDLLNIQDPIESYEPIKTSMTGNLRY